MEMTMAQPSWEFVSNLGDATPIDHGGLFLYRDASEGSPYGFEMERLERSSDSEDEEDEKATWIIHRVCLDRQKLVRHGPTNVYLVPYNYQPDWPHAISSYPEWYVDKLDDVSHCIGSSRIELEQALCSEDGALRAWAYEAIASYSGWENFDSEPLTLTRDEVEERYTKGELGTGYQLDDSIELSSSHMRPARYSKRKVRLPNVRGFSGGSKWEAEPDDLIEFAYSTSPEHVRFGRVLGRVDVPPIEKTPAKIGWLAVVELSSDGRAGFLRWVDPEWVSNCSSVPRAFLAWFFAAKLPSTPVVLKLDALGSLSSDYIAKYNGACEGCIVEHGLWDRERPCTHDSNRRLDEPARTCADCGAVITGKAWSAGPTEDGPSPEFCSKEHYERSEWAESEDE
jgi:hypothetical protein